MCWPTTSAVASSPTPVVATSNPAQATPAQAVAVRAGVYRLPVAGPPIVVTPFVVTDPYGPGHRGVDLSVPGGAQVLAASGGVITFAGWVVDRGVVTITHPDGIRTSYEPVDATVSASSVIASGQVIGVVQGIHGVCPPDACLHWSVRRGDIYLDPLTLLAPLGIVRLVS
jgi:murein DD-endopeptidase MepM/ murein hydrolase activator NlpD